MTQGKTRLLAEKLAIVDRYEAMIRHGELVTAPETPPDAAQQALTRLSQLRQLLLGTLDEATQQELLDALIAVGIEQEVVRDAR